MISECVRLRQCHRHVRLARLVVTSAQRRTRGLQVAALASWPEAQHSHLDQLARAAGAGDGDAVARGQLGVDELTLKVSSARLAAVPSWPNTCATKRLDSAGWRRCRVVAARVQNRTASLCSAAIRRCDRRRRRTARFCMRERHAPLSPSRRSATAPLSRGSPALRTRTVDAMEPLPGKFRLRSKCGNRLTASGHGRA